MSNLDSTVNFAKSIVPLGYSASATTIVLQAGYGAKFPAPPFNIVWWNSTDYSDPSDDPSVEVCRVTGVSTDTFTLVRAQESTAASAKNLTNKTYRILAGFTQTLLTQLANLATTNSRNNQTTGFLELRDTVTGKYQSISLQNGVLVFGAPIN